MSSPTGARLCLVATPIGNLGDMSARAITELDDADVIVCEDTRRTGLLLKHFSVSHGPMIVCNDHTEAQAAAEVVRRLDAGSRVALVTDAGTPGVSDPGRRVVRAAIEAGHRVTAVPGASAALTALAMSGFDAARFCFEGFLPRKGSERSERIAALVTEPRTAVIYESPRRVVRTLVDLEAELGGERFVVIARELTKLHEEVWRGPLADAVEHAQEVQPRGEYVLVVEGAVAATVADAEIVMALQAEIGAGATRRSAVDAVSRGLGVSRKRVYALALALD